MTTTTSDMTQSSTPELIASQEQVHAFIRDAHICRDCIGPHCETCQDHIAAIQNAYEVLTALRSQAEEVERLLAQVVAEMPDEVPALLHAFDGPMTSGDVAAAAGLKSGAFAVQFLKQYSLFERSPTRIPHQYLWQLSPLGQQLRAALKGDNHAKG